jgi:hypothetical protein
VADWILVPCLVTLRDEFNALSPGRDRRSDGSIGDRAHQDSPSDHNPDETGETPYEDDDKRNEVHAIDIDMTGPWPHGMTFDLAVRTVADRHRRGLDDRLQNIIWNGQIASRSWGWTWQTYRGANGHHEHGHFSARYNSIQEANTRPWGLLDRFGDDMDYDTFAAYMTKWAASPAGKERFEAAAKADVVPRLGTNGEPVPATDPNPNMGINSSHMYLARDLAVVRGKLDDVADDVAALVQAKNTGGVTPATTAPAQAPASKPAGTARGK